VFNSDNKTANQLFFRHLKRGTFMSTILHKTILASTLGISILTSPVFGNNDAEEINRSQTEQGIGLGSGATIGGLVAGPIGIVTGAFIGSLIGQNVSIEKRSNQLMLSNKVYEKKLDHSEKEIKTLKEQHSQQAITLNDAHLTIEKLFVQNQELKDSTFDFDVQFRTDSSEIEQQYKNHLIDLANYLHASTNIDIEIAGFTDRSGNEKYNLELSNQRAMQVKEFLIENGIEENRIITLAYGETQPLHQEENSENNFFDRRATIFLMPTHASTKNIAHEIVTAEDKVSIASKQQ
jgi:sortase system peptidoglycan-associated protein